MPFRFMPGWVIYRWRRSVWAAMFGISAFAFIHILMAALGVFAFFGVFSILFWAYFRFRPTRAATEEAVEG